jgi:phosphatidylglycerophosphate synthase
MGVYRRVRVPLVLDARHTSGPGAITCYRNDLVKFGAAGDTAMSENSEGQPAGGVKARRPIRARSSGWAAAAATWLVRRGVTPNSISIASVAFSALAAGALLATRWATRPAALAGLFGLAIAGIQARLLCNLFDGMVAIEGGRAGPAGEVYNDFPDRIADPLILVAAGYAAGGPWGADLGWLAACLALLTAYVRVLGRSLGAGIYFLGPMAKQHRMAVLTLACAIAAVAAVWKEHQAVLRWSLVLICVACVATVARRTARVVADLGAR